MTLGICVIYMCILIAHGPGGSCDECYAEKRTMVWDEREWS